MIAMIENDSLGRLWDLFMNCPKIAQGLHCLGFGSTYSWE